MASYGHCFIAFAVLGVIVAAVLAADGDKETTVDVLHSSTQLSPTTPRSSTRSPDRRHRTPDRRRSPMRAIEELVQYAIQKQEAVAVKSAEKVIKDRNEKFHALDKKIDKLMKKLATVQDHLGGKLDALLETKNERKSEDTDQITSTLKP